MRWSWRLGTIRGIEVRVHVTFLLALVWGAYLWGGGKLSGLWYGVLLTLVLFAVVVLHELGHSLAAQRYGIAVHDIVLLPIGGAARLSRMPEKPQQELVVALAGPAVNLVLIALLAPAVLFVSAPGLSIGEGLTLPSITTPGWVNFAAFLLVINVSLLLFNMVPAFPMDGGRVLRSLLAMWLPYGRATGIAVVVGRAFAILFGIYGIWTGNFTLTLVALFVFTGAGAEAQEVSSREALRQVTVTEILDGHALVLTPDLPAHLAFERLMRSPHLALAVVDQPGRLLGIVTKDGMQRKWSEGVRGSIGSFVEQVSLVVDCTASLYAVRQRMAESQTWIAAVYCGSTFAGLLDINTISQVLALHRLGHVFGQPDGPVTVKHSI